MANELLRIISGVVLQLTIDYTGQAEAIVSVLATHRQADVDRSCQPISLISSFAFSPIRIGLIPFQALVVDHTKFVSQTHSNRTTCPL